MILFTAGFELSPERYSELTATIDACNKANVAVYPMDVRGLVAPTVQLRRGGATHALSAANGSASARAGLQLAAYHPGAGASLVLAAQHGGGGGGGGHGGGGGGTGGGGTGGGGTGGGGTGVAGRAVGQAVALAGPVVPAADTAGREAAARAPEILAAAITATQTTISRGRLFRNFRRRRRRTSK